MDSIKLLDLLTSKGINFFTGVPDSLLKEFCGTIDRSIQKNHHLIAPNEGIAVAVAIGRHLAFGDIPFVYMQNSGFGNAFNPLIALAHKEVYRIPMLLMVGWRGEPGTSDEPQHMIQGRITSDLFELMEIPYLEVRNETELTSIASFIDLIDLSKSGPHALLVTTGTFEENVSETKCHSDRELTRQEAIEIIVSSLPSNSIVVATTGKLSRELTEIREKRGQEPNDFLVVGGMGHASGIALGISIAQPDRLVVCLDGDGALQMHLGVLAMIGARQPQNLLHVVFNNGTHESVGGQSVAAPELDYANLANVFGYAFAATVQNESELLQILKIAQSVVGPRLVDIKINSLSRSDLGRPKNSTFETKVNFQNHIQRGQ